MSPKYGDTVSRYGDMQSSCTWKDEEGEDASNLKALENRVFFCFTTGHSLLRRGSWNSRCLGPLCLPGTEKNEREKRENAVGQTYWD